MTFSGLRFEVFSLEMSHVEKNCYYGKEMETMVDVLGAYLQSLGFVLLARADALVMLAFCMQEV